MVKKTSTTKKNNDALDEPAITAAPQPELETVIAADADAAVEPAASAEIAAAPEAPAVKKPKAKAKAKAKPKAAALEPETAPEPEAIPVAEAEIAPEPEAISAPESKESPDAEDTPDPDAEDESESTPRPPAKLERLQKILAAAGVASRRHAEEMIEQGRIQVNGKVVTVLGTKADAGRDHIRVDGKLLHGAERLRYFVLNKPKGFVTTVKDPEGRPTVMQFFDKMKERLYPVGRLDYQSEGLLVVTNDGELANRLTKAGSGVEKTYLVKVAGQPTEAELNTLRGGVSIERGKPGSPQVRTSPARIRQVRQGDNPWYEVVLIEGRNRELRKMFEEVGHFVEKIRRTGYGPLVLDQEPGNLRELEPEELELLRKAAEGKRRTPKAKELRRRNAADAGQLPTVAPKPSGRPRTPRPFAPKPFADSAAPSRTPSRGPARSAERPRRATGTGPARFGSARPSRPPSRFAASSASDDRPRESRPRFESSRPSSERTGRTGASRPFTAKPTWDKQEHQDRPYNRTPSPRREAPDSDDDLGPVRPPNLHIEEISQWDRPTSSRPSTARPYSDRPRPSHSGPSRSSYSRPSFDRPAPSAHSGAAKPFHGKSGLARPYTTSSGKPRAGGARPSSKPGSPRSYGSSSRGPASGARYGSGPRAGADSRPSYGAKPFGRSSAGPVRRGGEGKSSFTPHSSRPYTPRAEGASDYRPTQAKPYPSSSSRAERKAGPGWKPRSTDRPSSVGRKPSFGGAGKSYGGSHSRPGGFSKSGYKGKPSGAGGKRTGFRPGGKPGGKKRS
jgi:23S rRNA pseudouridine2605 synthase